MGGVVGHDAAAEEKSRLAPGHAENSEGFGPDFSGASPVDEAGVHAGPECQALLPASPLESLQIGTCVAKKLGRP